MSSDMPSRFPESIALRRQARQLAIEWDGRYACIGLGVLRAACRCAECESGRRKGRAPALAADVQVTAIDPVGESGLRFFFDDGHDRGIYPWPYLYQLAFPIRPNSDADFDQEGY